MIRRRSRIKPIADSRRKIIAEYEKLKRAWWKLPDNRFCRVCPARAYIDDDWPSEPHRAVDVHHTRGRSGRFLILVEFWIPVCRSCHMFIDEHRMWAREKGFLGPWLCDKK